jgi:peptide/nickel transport system permease protein
MKTNSKSFIIGSVLIGLILVFVIVGIFYTPYDPNEMNGLLKNASPSLGHLFGTDNFGRDIFSRCMEGARTTLFVALITVLIGTIFGIIIGAISGYFGGLLDEILMRIIDVLLAFPSILLALVFVSVFGTGTYNIILALGILFIPSFARVVRSEFITLKELDYVKNAKLMGASNFRIMFIHILPNAFPILLSAVTIGFNNAILAEAGMSYLGLGVQPPDASLGRMLSEAQTYLFTAPWYAIAPGIIIVITVLGFSLMNEE